MGANPKTFARRSTARLLSDLAAVSRSECHCDAYHGFECGKHHRRDLIEMELQRRGNLPGPLSNPQQGE